MKHHIIRLKQGFLFLLFHLVLIGFSSVFLPPLFARQGLPAYSFVILIVIGTFFTSVLIPFFNNFQINKSLALGYVSLGLMTLTIVYLPTTIAFISYAFLWAFGIIFFWQPINYLFYKSSKN
ncbi:TPA: hypothetical protein HA278_05775, partial [Candidatus Woesearchaeota archaeon]|nr:hypothetical protein [Candidatus Woesearchaeota archaeon]